MQSKPPLLMDSTEALGFLRRRGVKFTSRRQAQRWLKSNHVPTIGQGRATLYDGDALAERLLGEPMPAATRARLGLPTGPRRENRKRGEK